MKPRYSNSGSNAFTLTDAVVACLVLLILAIIFNALLMVLAKQKINHGVNCVNNLKEVTLGAWIWAGDHNGKFPMQVSVADGGTMEFAQRGEVLKTFLLMSNQLATPIILHCQKDTDHEEATNFSTGFSTRNISYFIGVDADKSAPRSIFIGDDNLQMVSALVKPGLLLVTNKADIGWTSARHSYGKINQGNIAFSDGSVEEMTSSGLAADFTNSVTRLAIP